MESKMLPQLILISIISTVLGVKDCYWNRKCSYDQFSTKTPYETIRGDIRDQPSTSCKTISLWTIHRHGNRNAGSSGTEEIKFLQNKIKEEIESSLTAQPASCVQDIEDILRWKWNATMDVSTSFLTGVGYEELFDIGKRIRHRYIDAFAVPSDKVYFRATNAQRTITSAIAFIHGLTDGTTITNFTMDEPTEIDDVIRPYENCEAYQEQVKNGQTLSAELDAFDSSQEYLAVVGRVRAKLNIKYELTPEEVYTLYELCRFDRSWNVKLQSPWCSFFTEHDLVVLEYRDDVRHYYRNAYGSQINVMLGALPLKDLYENFEKAVNGNGLSLVSYFTHNAMMEMLFSALGLFKDTEPIRGAVRNPNRLWSTSEVGAFGTNFIAILNRCDDSGVQSHRVQFLLNEKPTSLCPEAGCTWQQFVDRFQNFRNANLDFCVNKKLEDHPSAGNLDRVAHRLLISFMIVVLIMIVLQ